MKVGFSFWGFLTPLEKNAYVNTPDGERGNRVDFVDELLKRGHEVIRLQVQRDDEPYPGVSTGQRGRTQVRILQNLTTHASASSWTFIIKRGFPSSFTMVTSR